LIERFKKRLHSLDDWLTECWITGCCWSSDQSL